MDFDLTWLLWGLPVAFALGWFASRLDLRQMRIENRLAPKAYFRGLNFLLNEQSDKAIDAFIDVVRIEPETVELHFALGNLFRRRGESDRAIRVHQNLVDRAGLDPAEREHALYELGQDFLKAGLLDRAEDAFNRLESSRYAPSALHHRLEIAQMVRDWPQSISLAQRLARDLGENRGREIAHFRCELAQRALLAAPGPARIEEARRELDEAVRAEPSHPRPWLLKGETALAEGDAAAAITAWQKVARASPQHLSLVADGWLRAHEMAGRRDQGMASLEAIHREHPSIDSFAALASARAARDGNGSARRWAEQALREAPSLLGLEKLLAMKAPVVEGEERAEVELAQRLIQAQARRLSRYVCRNCGFKARQFYWHCPGCNQWDTYAPKRSEELERD
ncbi:MAG: lipopolysaccharide assembly protein LapB [Gammaproteobacteria bacterium]